MSSSGKWIIVSAWTAVGLQIPFALLAPSYHAFFHIALLAVFAGTITLSQITIRDLKRTVRLMDLRLPMFQREEPFL